MLLFILGTLLLWLPNHGNLQQETLWTYFHVDRFIIFIIFTDPIAKCLSAGDVYRSDRYRALYSLVTHTDKRPTTLLVSKALNAAFIVYCIVTKTTFFGEKASCFSDMYQNVDVVFVAGLILRHYQMLQMNDHGVRFFFIVYHLKPFFLNN